MVHLRRVTRLGHTHKQCAQTMGLSGRSKGLEQERPSYGSFSFFFSFFIYHFLFSSSFLAFFTFFHFFQLSLFYSKIELTSSSSFLCMEILVFSPSSPTLGILCKSQVCNIGVSFLSVFYHKRSSRYVVDAALMFLGIVCPLFFLILT